MCAMMTLVERRGWFKASRDSLADMTQDPRRKPARTFYYLATINVP
jgi:hypothetical protein